MNVSAIAKTTKQPKGGYVPISKFDWFRITEGNELAPEENIHSSIVGMAVDNLTRICAGVEKKDVFYVAVKGASRAAKNGNSGALEKAIYLLSGITGADDQSVINACKLATYEVWARSIGYNGYGWKGPDETNPDEDTIHNIQEMLKRTACWLDVFKPLVKTGFTFAPVENVTEEKFMEVMLSGEGSWGGYTPTVSSGDGDYLTKNTIWDLKVSKSKPTTKNSLQLLMYWIMGQHSGQEIFKNVNNIGFFNPRRNEIYFMNINEVGDEVISTVEKDVIRY